MLRLLVYGLIMTGRTIDLQPPERPLSQTTLTFRAVGSIGWFAVALAGAGAVLPWLLAFDGTGAAAVQRHVMGLFCLAIVHLTLSHIFHPTISRVHMGLLSFGVCAYAVGALLATISREAAWLMPLGTVAVLAGVGLVWREPVVTWNGWERRVFVALILAGIALDGSLVLASLAPESAWSTYLGPADALRFRLLSLARSAAMILPTLAWLHQEAARHQILSSFSRCWSCLGLHTGAIVMPSVLLLIVRP